MLLSQTPGSFSWVPTAAWIKAKPSCAGLLSEASRESWETRCSEEAGRGRWWVPRGLCRVRGHQGAFCGATGHAHFLQASGWPLRSWPVAPPGLSLAAGGRYPGDKGHAEAAGAGHWAPGCAPYATECTSCHGYRRFIRQSCSGWVATQCTKACGRATSLAWCLRPLATDLLAGAQQSLLGRRPQQGGESCWTRASRIWP